MGETDAAKGETYYQGLNEWLLRSVPDDARILLEVGCAEGRLGAALKRARPDRQVFGIEKEATPAARASERLDRVFQVDLERETPALEPRSIDCILLGDVLEHLRDPLAVLRRLLPLLRPDGLVLCCIPNVQHHSVIAALLRGDFQYQQLGIMDATHLRFFTYASFTKLLLDAGLEPEIIDHVPSPPPPALMEALGPALRQVGADAALAQVFLGSYQYVFRATPLGWSASGDPEEPITFITCVNDDAVLRDNLLASPCLQAATPHQILEVREADSVAAAFAAAIHHAIHPLVVLVHQDVYLPAGWPRRFASQWRAARERFGNVQVAGLYGASLDPAVEGQVRRSGRISDRYRLLRSGPLPAPVDTLDEVLLAFPRDTELRLDPSLGFHNYGSDVCYQARRSGGRAMVLDAPCFHNSGFGDALPPAFHRSQNRLREKWRSELPLATNCGLVT